MDNSGSAIPNIPPDEDHLVQLQAGVLGNFNNRTGREKGEERQGRQEISNLPPHGLPLLTISRSWVERDRVYSPDAAGQNTSFVPRRRGGHKGGLS